jgi:hypothetical protein
MQTEQLYTLCFIKVFYTFWKKAIGDLEEWDKFTNLCFNNINLLLNEIYTYHMGKCHGLVKTIFQLYIGGQCYWSRKPEYPQITSELPKVNDKLHTCVRTFQT